MGLKLQFLNCIFPNVRLEFRTFGRKFERSTKNSNVFDGFAKLAGRSSWDEVSHGDLWQKILENKQGRTGDCSVVVTKVLGHAKAEDVENGRTTWENKIGNDCADRLARQGAAKHKVGPDILAAAASRKDLAVRVQSMMLAIVKARNQQLHPNCEDGHGTSENWERERTPKMMSSASRPAKLPLARLQI